MINGSLEANASSIDPKRRGVRIPSDATYCAISAVGEDARDNNLMRTIAALADLRSVVRVLSAWGQFYHTLRA